MVGTQALRQPVACITAAGLGDKHPEWSVAAALLSDWQ
jgi:hypothetical protein